MKISAILLGAGESKRMGRDKLLLPWKRKTMLEHCLQVLLRSKIDRVIVVLDRKKERIAHYFSGNRVKVVFNPDPRKGMSSSIRKGIQALTQQGDGILIALGDMPFLKPRTIKAIIKAFREGKGGIILPSFKGKQGHPVLFHRKYEEELLKLRGDRGGKAVVMKHPEDVYVLSVKSEGVIRDIDTWEAYRKELLRREAGKGLVRKE